jgi:predicted Zn-dependent protease
MSWRAEAIRRAALVVVVACLGASFAAAQSKRTIAELGRLDPPAYASPLVRTGERSEVFDDAIAAYGARQYERSADLLRRVVAAEPDDVAANFYLAMSLMMTDEVGEAEDRLGAVLAAEPSAFTSPARYVLAKAEIRLRRLDAAERELTVVADSASTYAQPAQALLSKVRAAKRQE